MDLPRAAVAQRNIEIAVGAETDPAALVVGEAGGLIDCKNKRGACRVDLVGIAG